MKNILFALTTFGFLTSCEKTEEIEPFVQQGNNPYQYNLYWSAPSLGITIVDLKPTSVRDYVEFNPSTGLNEVYGEQVNFYNHDSTILIQFSYEFGKGVTQSYGSINGKTFIANLQTNTINICNSSQNVPIVFDLFSGKINS